MRIPKLFKFTILNFYQKILYAKGSPIEQTEYSFIPLKYKDFDKYPHIFKKEYFDEYKHRFAINTKCFAIFYNNNIVHYFWISGGSLKVDEIEKTLDFLPDELCIFDVFTIEEFRGKGLFQLALKFGTDFAFGNGAKRLIIYAESSNKPSIKAIEKSGFKIYKKIIFLKILGIKFYF
jgi:hypothetical protein